jgi:Spy/CpxP family protein refolding chaperone
MNGEKPMNFKKLVLIAATAALVCGALAQGGGQGRRGGFGQGGALQLTGREDVQKDLALTDDQKAKLSELRDKAQAKQREAFTAAREAAGDDRDAMMKAMQTTMAKLNEENAKDIAGVLTADQNKRLKEIRIQFSGASIVTQDMAIQKELGITDDQKAKFTDLQTRQRAAMTEVFQNSQGDQAAIREAMTKNQKVMEEEIKKILTDDQKAKLKDMAGTKPFARVDPPAGGGGGR